MIILYDNNTVALSSNWLPVGFTKHTPSTLFVDHAPFNLQTTITLWARNPCCLEPCSRSKSNGYINSQNRPEREVFLAACFQPLLARPSLVLHMPPNRHDITIALLSVAETNHERHHPRGHQSLTQSMHFYQPREQRDGMQAHFANIRQVA